MRTLLSAATALVLALSVSACATSASQGGVKTLKAPDKVVLLTVTMPDGTESGLVVPDGDMGTVKIDEIHIYAFQPKVAGAAVAITVMELENFGAEGKRQSWRQLDKLALASGSAGATKTTPAFAVRVDGIEKAIQ